MKQENNLEKRTQESMIKSALIPGGLFYCLGKQVEKKEIASREKYNLYMGAMMGELVKGIVYASAAYELFLK